MHTQPLQTDNVSDIWRINEEGLPGVGKVSQADLVDLLRLSELALGVFDQHDLMGFVLCLPPATRYASLNYAWFNERYDHFLYVDRIAVSQHYRNREVGTLLYAAVIAEADKNSRPVAAEVSLNPPNLGSMRFHGRHNFREVGVLHHKDKSVTMLMRPVSGRKDQEI